MLLTIANMNCSGCLRGVTAAIRSVDPAAEVEADLPARRIALRSDGPLPALLAALAAAGFEARPLDGGAP